MRFLGIASLILLGSCGPPPPSRPPETTLGLEIAVEGPLEVGKPVRLRARIKNTGAHEGAGVMNLDGSYYPFRYPAYVIRWYGPRESDSSDLNFIGGICGTCAPLQVADIVSLKPGENFDPFGPGSFRHRKIEVIPRTPGPHHVELTVDYFPPETKQWNSLGGPLDKSVLDRLARVPRVRMMAKADFVVK